MRIVFYTAQLEAKKLEIFKLLVAAMSDNALNQAVFCRYSGGYDLLNLIQYYDVPEALRILLSGMSSLSDQMAQRAMNIMHNTRAISGKEIWKTTLIEGVIDLFIHII